MADTRADNPLDNLITTVQASIDRIEAQRHKLYEADFYWHSPRLRQASAELDIIEADLRAAYTDLENVMGRYEEEATPLGARIAVAVSQRD